MSFVDRPRTISSQRRVRAYAAVAVVAQFLGSAACGPSPAAALGDTPTTASANTHDFFHSLALRFGPLTRSERLKVVRARYVRGSLAPSRVFDDTVVWVSRVGDTRTLVVAGTPLPDGRYSLDVVPGAGSPAQTGDSRHVIRLRELGDDVYEWQSLDELAIGAASAASLDTMRQRFLAAAEGHSAQALRVGWSRALPRTAAALGRLFAIDSLVTTPLADGTTSLAMTLSMHPDGLRADLPDYAEWVRKYAGGSRYRLTLADYAGAPYLQVVAYGDVVRIRARTRRGILQPLVGAAIDAPRDSMRLRIDFSSRVSIFTVGLSNLVADVARVSDEHERGWNMHFRREPNWRFPLAVDHLMRGALRRPFDGQGAWMRVTARDVPGQPTLLVRDFRMDVEESAIVRWIGSIGNSAMRDVTVRVERQKDQFFADGLTALGTDLSAQLGTLPAAEH